MTFDDFPQYYPIKVRFQPLQTNDLSNLSPPIGWEGIVEKCWVIDNGGYYEGQWCYMDKNYKYGWLPECDLILLGSGKDEV